MNTLEIIGLLVLWTGGLAGAMYYIAEYLNRTWEAVQDKQREKLAAKIKAQQSITTSSPLSNPLCGSVIRHPRADVKDIATAMGVSVEVLRHFGVIGANDTVQHLFGIHVMNLAKFATEIDAIRNVPTGLTAAMYGITNNN
jgi:hypothetical protein